MTRSAMKPLEGLLVVSMEQAVAAPYCASRLDRFAPGGLYPMIFPSLREGQGVGEGEGTGAEDADANEE